MRLTFGEMTLDTDARQLLRGSEPLSLSPKAFDLLAHLIEQHPRALSKDELHHRLWPGTFVSETNLAGLVAEIRRALQDDARTPRYVRTVQRFGYAFAGRVGSEMVREMPPARPGSCRLVRGKREIPLMDGENVLGRELESGALDSVSVSRRHAKIVVEGTLAYLEDLGSKNGTFLRGRRIRARKALADGDTIQLGSVSLVFRVPANTRSTRTWKRR
jgi:DNA-binding winged helix-turn-helix (wHTH) protein